MKPTYIGFNTQPYAIIVPNYKPLVQAMLQDGWLLQKYSRGEIA